MPGVVGARRGSRATGQKQGALLTRDFQVGRRSDQDLASADINTPPIGIVLVDDQELVALRERGFFGRGAGIGVESLCSDSCGAKEGQQLQMAVKLGRQHLLFSMGSTYERGK